jgi:hypothetical protein
MGTIDFTPSDPRTWSDFRDPATHGFVKVDCDTTQEEVLFQSGAYLVGIAAFWLFLVGRGLGSRATWRVPESPALILPGILLAMGVVLCLARALTDDFYLVDPKRHLVYGHYRFAFMRRIVLLLERKDVLAVSTASQKRQSRYSTWWEYRVALVRADGRIVPMSNWTRDGLWASNNAAQNLATELECQWVEAPEQQRLVVTMKDGVPSVALVPFSWLASVGTYWIVSALFALAAIGLVGASASGWLR